MASNPNARLIDENGVITIPIVFHVLHKGEAVGTGTNLSDALLIEQIEILNQCYSQTNDQTVVAQVFRNLAGNPLEKYSILVERQMQVFYLNLKERAQRHFILTSMGCYLVMVLSNENFLPWVIVIELRRR